jgi:hypothetical protein
MAKGSFNERQRADCGGGRTARHSVIQNAIARSVDPRVPWKASNDIPTLTTSKNL